MSAEPERDIKGKVEDEIAQLRQAKFKCTYDDKGKLIDLPTPIPAPDDGPGQRAWMSAAWPLHPAHPVTRTQQLGNRGPNGHLVVSRRDALAIRFEPITKLNTPTKLIETLSSYLLGIDGRCPAYSGNHCGLISWVLRMLAENDEVISEDEEMLTIIGACLQVAAVAVEDHTTYGMTREQRWDAAAALCRDVDPTTNKWYGPPHYLIDSETGELIIGLRDLEDAARGMRTSVPHGWVTGRMQSLGWKRIVLDAHEMSGRTGRRGPHRRPVAFRGRPPETVTT
jgi:hypothetical protein